MRRGAARFRRGAVDARRRSPPKRRSGRRRQTSGSGRLAVGAVHGRDSTQRVKRSSRCASAPSATCCSTSSSCTSGSSGARCRKAPRRRAVGAGGQAANVAAWAAELGAEARFVGKRGLDAAGELVARELRPAASSCSGPVEEGRNGVVVSLVTRGRRPDDAHRPRRRSGFARRGARRALVRRRATGSTCPATRRCARPIEEAAAKAARAVQCSGAAGVSIDSRVRVGDRRVRGRETAPRRLELLRPRARVRERGRAGRDRGRGARDARAQARARDRVRASTARDYPLRCPRTVVDTRPARATRSRPGYLVGGPELARRRRGRRACVAQLGSDAVIRVAPEIADALRAARAPVVAPRDDARRARLPGGRGRRGRPRAARAPCARRARCRRRSAFSTARVRRRPRPTRARALRRPTRRRSARATSRPRAVQGAVGATTVGGTLAGLPRSRASGFMGTGGSAASTAAGRALPDVSADLGELARTRALVVSSGVKSLLDVPATHGVSSRRSACRCSAAARTSCRSSTPRAAARRSPHASRPPAEAAARRARALGARRHAAARSPVQPRREPRRRRAADRGGRCAKPRSAASAARRVTPFVLGRLHERSGGRTLARRTASSSSRTRGSPAEVAVACSGASSTAPRSSSMSSRRQRLESSRRRALLSATDTRAIVAGVRRLDDAHEVESARAWPTGAAPWRRASTSRFTSAQPVRVRLQRSARPARSGSTA